MARSLIRPSFKISNRIERIIIVNFFNDRFVVDYRVAKATRLASSPSLIR